MFSIKLLKVKKYLNENLLKKFITFNQTLYFFFVLFILKANKDLQFCVNYWKLNVIFKRNKYSLSLINEIIDKIVSCKHLTRLNIISAFNKLQMHFNSKNYIIFITALKAYKYKVLSFKLTNKSIFFQQLEVIVSEQDLRINLSKMIIIVNWTTLINLKEIQNFVKFVNFYHHFIKDFFKLVKSFTQLTRKDTSFVWNEVCIQAFKNLKKQISFASVLRHFDFKHQTILKINALNYVKGEILSQYNNESVLHLMIFYSKSMILAEINYHIYEKKLLIIIRCFKHWWLKLKCTELLIQIFINHQALKIFMKNKQLS